MTNKMSEYPAATAHGAARARIVVVLPLLAEQREMKRQRAERILELVR
jgi:putative ubiquitin-RnfH superfamily antitoxin RatB of RatAB toxin-antitoxin module